MNRFICFSKAEKLPNKKPREFPGAVYFLRHEWWCIDSRMEMFAAQTETIARRHHGAFCRAPGTEHLLAERAAIDNEMRSRPIGNRRRYAHAFLCEKLFDEFHLRVSRHYLRSRRERPICPLGRGYRTLSEFLKGVRSTQGASRERFMWLAESCTCTTKVELCVERKSLDNILSEPSLKFVKRPLSSHFDEEAIKQGTRCFDEARIDVVIHAFLLSMLMWIDTE
jgi:hypothetical protein